MDVSESKEKLTEPESVAENSPTEANEEEAKLKDGDVGDSKFNGEKEKSDAKNVENVSTVESETQETKETVTSKEIKKLVEDNTKDESLQTADQGLGTAEVGSEDVGETIENVVTQDTPVQTEGRESPSKTSDNEKGAGTDSRSESEAPLVAPPTSKAEHSTVSESPGRQVPISTKDGSDVTGKLLLYTKELLGLLIFVTDCMKFSLQGDSLIVPLHPPPSLAISAHTHTYTDTGTHIQCTQTCQPVTHTTENAVLYTLFNDSTYLLNYFEILLNIY